MNALLQRWNQGPMGAVLRLRVRSALNPLLWLCGVLAVPLIIAMRLFQFHAWAFAALFALFALLVLTAIGSYVFMLLARPHMLQSEDYQLRQTALTMFGMKGLAKDVTPFDVVSVANPMYSLPDRETTESGGNNA